MCAGLHHVLVFLYDTLLARINRLELWAVEVLLGVDSASEVYKRWDEKRKLQITFRALPGVSQLKNLNEWTRAIAKVPLDDRNSVDSLESHLLCGTLCPRTVSAGHLTHAGSPSTRAAASTVSLRLRFIQRAIDW